MPKAKTKKSVAKRVKITATGKVLCHQPGGGHLKSRKSPKRLRRFRKEIELSNAFSRHARTLLGA
jgi:large subunit ribosomal protein L35